LSLKVISHPPTTTQNPTGAIVALHGWGANAQDLAPLVPYFNLPDYHFFFLDAPFPHSYTDYGKMWYDFESMSNNFQSDDSSLLHSRELLIQWLQDLPKNT
jgi:phospholipase/carboxylesterase